MATKKAETGEQIDIINVEQGVFDAYILGTSPLICNRMSQKVMHDLLAPKGKKTAAEKAGSLKHDPLEEFRASPYRTPDGEGALIGLMPTAFKKAIGTAALDMPGAKKAQILRLIYVEGNLIPIYGLPQLFMAVTRSADMNRTPDVRTRAILPEWACKLTIRFTKPILRHQSIVNLLAAAGFQSGVGDWRQEKGSGNYGSFKVVPADDADWKRIVAQQGRTKQLKAMETPTCYDDETSELLSWYDVEIKRRGFKVAA